MLIPIPDKLKPLLKKLVEDIIAGNFDQLVANGQLDKAQVEGTIEVIQHYGKTLVSLPDEAFMIYDATPVYDNVNLLGIDLPLWTAEEGRSDLELRVEAIISGDNTEIKILDLLVP